MKLIGKILPNSLKKLAIAKLAYKLIEEYTTFLPLKLYYLRNNLFKKHHFIVFCYPELPSYYHTLYNICRYSNFKITNKPYKADCIVYFEDTTVRKIKPLIKSLSKKKKVVNINCRDIRKSTIDIIHKRIFGYGLTVSPLTYKKDYIRKSDQNSAHDGKIFRGSHKPVKGYVYQRLIDNTSGNTACDIRLPVFKDNIPFAYTKYRPFDMRFSDDYTDVKMVKILRVINKSEYAKIIRLCKAIGLDFGELDALRDRKTGKLYIVDINNTPAGPSFFLSYNKKLEALRLLSKEFYRAFII